MSGIDGAEEGGTAPACSLVSIGGDGTFRAPEPGSAVLEDAGDDPRLAALLRLRALLGDDPEEQIGSRLQLPAALGTESADHLLPASLSLLAETTGDLASYGWRVGPGAGRAWLRASELRERTLDAARIAWLGYEGPVMLTALGPVTLAAATFLGSGERTLSDRGALRDLPHLLAAGIAEQAAALRARVPGAQVRLLVREDHALPVMQGRVPVPSGYRTYAALPAPTIGELWSALLDALAGAGIGRDRISLSHATQADLLRAAQSAGTGAHAIAPAALPVLSARSGQEPWELLAGAREAGTGLELLLDPAAAGPQLDRFATGWSRLGYGARDLAGLALLAHRTHQRPGATGAADPASEPAAASLLTEGDIESLLRLAPAWAERIAA